jgi:serine/threonine protein kinase
MLLFPSVPSTNGTFVNRVKVGKGQHTVLFEGSKIEFLTASVQKKEEFPLEYYFLSSQETSPSVTPAHPGDTYFASNFTISQTLGTGQFGVVKLGIRKQTGEKVAVKEIDKKKVISVHAHHPISVLDEFLILRRLNHPHIVNVLDGFECSSFTCVVME